MAGVGLVELITQLTPAERDQEHRNIVLKISMPGRGSGRDRRRSFCSDTCRRKPAAAVAERSPELAPRSSVLACNALHAPPIWDDVTGTLAWPRVRHNVSSPASRRPREPCLWRAPNDVRRSVDSFADHGPPPDNRERRRFEAGSRQTPF